MSVNVLKVPQARMKTTTYNGFWNIMPALVYTRFYARDRFFGRCKRQKYQLYRVTISAPLTDSSHINFLISPLFRRAKYESISCLTMGARKYSPKIFGTQIKNTSASEISSRGPNCTMHPKTTQRQKMILYTFCLGALSPNK